jgi:branched-chain amino acid transport system ATP-binding protein
MTLVVEDLDAGYGPIHALQDVSLTAGEGEIVALIGSNGAGKSTMLMVISGLVPARRGYVRWRDEPLGELPPQEIITRRVAHVPEGRHVFLSLSVDENLQKGAYRCRDKDSIIHTREKVLSMFPRLKERLSQSAGTLSGGEQQMLAIGRALMSSPKLPLLDEPSMGLAPIIAEKIFDAFAAIAKEGTSILLVKQNLAMAFLVARRAYVLQNGIIVREGSVESLRDDPALHETYLGGAVESNMPQKVAPQTRVTPWRSDLHVHGYSAGPFSDRPFLGIVRLTRANL